MKVVTVNASKTYQVKIGSGLLAHLGEELAAVSKAARVAIVSDSTVWPIYGKTAESSLQKAGFETVNFVFPAGESSKNGTVYLSLLNFLAENQLTRSDCLIALGGGVVYPPAVGGMARIRHLVPEPMRSSRWALRRASFTR